MKKLFIAVAALLAWTVAHVEPAAAQAGVPKEVNYYGVDFSRTRTFGAYETGEQFKAAFHAINSLVTDEWSKYNPGKLLHKKIAVRDIAVAQACNDKIDPALIATSESTYTLSREDIMAMVKGYDVEERDGTGLVVGQLLDKSAATGSFVIVYFDIATREVIYARPLSGEARGFGLRNYWARSLYNVLAGK